MSNENTVQTTSGFSNRQKAGFAVAAFAAAATTVFVMMNDAPKETSQAPVTEPVVTTVAPPTPVDPPVETVKIVSLDDLEPIERPEKTVVFDMPAYQNLPTNYKELPQMSFKPQADEILAYAESFVPEVKPAVLAETMIRIASENIKVSTQATKDMGYFLANGRGGMQESDALANSFYEASLQNSEGANRQAAHDLGYHLLHAKGAEADYDRAHDLLSTAHENGHPLSGAMLNYMEKHGLAPSR